MYKFEDGKWTECEEDVLGVDPAAMAKDMDKGMRAAGWMENYNVGHRDGMSVRAWSHSEKKAFLVDYSDGCYCYEVYVPKFPDFVELMAKMSTIAMAATIAEHDTADFIFNFVYKKTQSERKR